MDSEVSKDAGTFADCTNEATEIATNSGIYYLDLTSTEMNADCVIVKCTWTNTNALPTVLVLYPQEAGDIQVNPTYWNGGAIPAPNQTGVPIADVGYWKGTAAAAVDTAGYPKVTVKSGTGTGEVALASGQVTVGTNSDKTGYGLADGAITAAKIATDAIDADALAADAIAEINATVDVALADYDAPTNAEMVARTLAAASYATASAVATLQTSVDGLPTVAEILDAMFLDNSGNDYGDAVAGSVVKELLDGVAAGAASLTALVDGILDEAIASHLTAGSVGEAINDAAAGGGGGLDAAGVRAAVGLGSANLDTQLGDIPTVSEFNARTLAAASYATAAAITALNNLSAAQVNAEMLDVLNVDTFAELTAIPDFPMTLKQAILLILAAARNKITETKLSETAVTHTLYRNDGSTPLGTRDIAKSGDTLSIGELT